YPADREERVTVAYRVPEPHGLVTADMARFYTRISAEIPEDALVAGNPFNGSAMLWTLADREVVFPHFRGEHSADQTVLAERLNAVGTDPEVCRAVRAVGVDYLLVGAVEFRTYDTHWSYYRGLSDPGPAPGFELVDTDGRTRLYRITACD
ncbi:MAG: hypothetical protein M3422_24260, partial [Actinomycetota bacterium]|nr:hypothetical protein [Actinomycetota bacterium]